MLPDAEVIACCATTYSHPLARWLLGDSLHPGGLPLTTQVGQLLRISAASRVLDAGSGRGASAVHLARTIGCQVVGVTLEDDGVAAGLELARRQGVEERVTFLQADIQEVDPPTDSFDAVLMECVLSILPRKDAALQQLHRLLAPGGRLGLTDVTVSGPLPPELQGVLAVAGCVGDARPLDGYRSLIEAAGFVVEQSQDLREAATSLLRDVRGKLLMAEVASKLGKLPISADLLATGKRLLGGVEGLVQQEVLSYGLVMAHKPG